MCYPPGSKRFYETLKVPGVKVEDITQVCPGHIHIELAADAGTNTDIEGLKQRYLDALIPHVPIGTKTTVSIK